MTTNNVVPVDNPFYNADRRRAAALWAHWLADDDAGMRQIMHEALDADRLHHLPLSIMMVALDVSPVLLTQAAKFREVAALYGYVEVDEEANRDPGSGR
ncbi:hypothetical protein ACHIPZ_04950 [Antrihabitans sp. NCIMB 15449]|uniref:Uncharacterized protein n=1 Tax=Antrihabitans spumae TaxID=3373370 RepID=A0ABW7JHX4_9NOCA